LQVVAVNLNEKEMRRPFIKILGLLVVLIAVGLIFTSIQASKKFKFSRSAEDIHAELVNRDYLMSPQKVKKIIDAKDDNYIFVDIRNPRDYANFHIESAVNVPIQQALDDAYISELKNSKIKVLYSQESIKADQIRVLLTQYGYENLYVLQGGASYWKEHMVSRDVFKSGEEYDDEKLIFDPAKLKKQN